MSFSSGPSAVMANGRGTIVAWTPDSGDVAFEPWGTFEEGEVKALRTGWKGARYKAATKDEVLHLIGDCWNAGVANPSLQPTGSGGG